MRFAHAAHVIPVIGKSIRSPRPSDADWSCRAPSTGARSTIVAADDFASSSMRRSVGRGRACVASWFALERRLAAGGAEVIPSAGIFGGAGSRRGVNPHAANGVGDATVGGIDGAGIICHTLSLPAQRAAVYMRSTNSSYIASAVAGSDWIAADAQCLR